jgi:site-specific DNA recombinase
MTPSHTTKGCNRRYHYYTCCSAQKRGWKTCPSKSVPAGPVEAFVVEQIKCIGRDPALLREVLAQAWARVEARSAELAAEERVVVKDLSTWHRQVAELSDRFRPGEDNADVVGRLVDMHERIDRAEGQVQQVRDRIKAVANEVVSEDEARRALAAFDPVWGTLTPREQARVVALLVEQVEYDGAAGRVAVAFRPTGIKTLADELSQRCEEAA